MTRGRPEHDAVRIPSCRSAATLLVAALLLTGCSAAKDDPAPAPTSVASTSAGPTSAAPTSAAPTSTAATSRGPTAGPPPATTPVQPPTPGSTEATVPSEKVTRRKAVTLDGRGEATAGVAVTMTKVAAFTAKAKGPGEVSGPALALTVAVANGTSRPVDLGSAVVNVTASDGTPAAQLTGKPARPLRGSVESNAKATGVYVFTLDKTVRNPVTVEVAVSPSDPIVVFRGRAAS